MRGNLFTYRTMDDPWLSEMRHAPEKTLRALMPELEQMIGPFSIEKPIQIRPVDLYVSRGHFQPGLVLVGDAFATSCPASGNGVRKVITDVERLCNVYIPQWLATPGMDTEKIAAFYADPVKCACDRSSLNKALTLNAYSTDAAPIWRARRNARFVNISPSASLVACGCGFRDSFQAAPITRSCRFGAVKSRRPIIFNFSAGLAARPRFSA